MRSRSPLAALLFGACLPVAAAGGAGALSVRASVDVAIVIPRVMQLRTLDQPRVVTVSAEDAARGEVSVSGLRVELLDNDRDGYVVEGRLDGPFAEAIIDGLAAPLDVKPQEGGEALMPSMVGKPRPRPFAVRYRLLLREGTPPGVYRWPVSLSIRSP